jgi:hypothetical protein
MKRIVYFLLMFCAALSFTACSEDTVANKQVERIPGEAADLKGEEYITVGESSKMLLQINPSTGCIRWEDKATGEAMETKIFDTEQKDTSLKSDVVAYYFSGTEAEKYKAYTSMDSYSYGVEMDTMTYEKLDNGIRICYSLGSDKITYKDFPAYISEDRMNEFVLQYLDDKQKKSLLNQYRLTKSGVYARETNKDNPLAGLAAKQLNEFFYEIGKYTYVELEADNTEYDKLDEMPSKQTITMTMEYYLDGDDLIVRIPTSEMTWNEDFPIKSLDVLPYFMSTKETKDGYLFIPDGSGALINLNSTKLKEYQFTSRYYGGDVLIGAQDYLTSKAYMTMPVCGIKVGNHAVLGIIEDGAEIATLSAYINGSYNNIPYSRVSLNFMMNEDQPLASFTGAITSYTLRKVSTDYYSKDIKLRYCFLTGEEADYCGMAQAYKNYLMKQGDLAQSKPEDNAPFFVELLGEVNKKSFFLGIPYKGIQKLTTFDQASDILKNLNDCGVMNMKVEYSGMVNEGLNQTAVEKVKLSGQLGGKKDFHKLLDTADSLGAQIYPNILLQTAYTSKALSKKESSFFINGQVAELYDFSLVSLNVDTNNPYPRYIISPTYIKKYLQKFLNSYRKLGISNLASEDFMTFISADYRKGHNVSMTNSIGNYLEALDSLSEDNTLMLSNPISPAYAKTGYITDLPMDNSRQKIYDTSVPFAQMVFDGCITYSSEYINTDLNDIRANLMKAIETRSAMKFRFIASDTSVLEGTTADDVFAAEYSAWKDKIGEYYRIYNEFYQRVKGAQIVEHEIAGTNSEQVIVTYSNGVKVYLNYGDEAAVIDGVTVAADDFVVQ